MKHFTLAVCLACTFLASQPAFAADVTLPAGTVVLVKLADAIDSDRDAVDQQYAAVLTAPISVPGSPAIPAGSRATVSLVRNNLGWLTQLTGIVIDGRSFDISSSAGTIVVPGTGTEPAAGEALLNRIGLTPENPQPSTRIQLAASTQLRFSLIGSVVPARPAASTRRSRSAASSGSSPAASRATPRRSTGVPYLCDATDTSDRATTSYYVADVLKTSDSPAMVESSWHQFLVSTYPYRFANNPRATVRCTRIAESDAARSPRRLEGDLNPDNSGVIQTRWRYTLGPPPKQSSDAGSAQR